jgi:hypothetical protein
MSRYHRYSGTSAQLGQQGSSGRYLHLLALLVWIIPHRHISRDPNHTPLRTVYGHGHLTRGQRDLRVLCTGF